jgi:hypothetical protein
LDDSLPSAILTWLSCVLLFNVFHQLNANFSYGHSQFKRLDIFPKKSFDVTIYQNAILVGFSLLKVFLCLKQVKQDAQGLSLYLKKFGFYSLYSIISLLS